MRRYVVRFFKGVFSSQGRPVEICQRWFEIEAADKAAAIEAAKPMFIAAEGVPEWSLRADRIDAIETEFPS